MLGDVQITAVAVKDTFEAQCFCILFGLSAVKSSEAAQITLKETAKIAQEVEKNVPGGVGQFLVSTVVSAAGTRPFHCAEESSAGSRSGFQFK